LDEAQGKENSFILLGMRNLRMSTLPDAPISFFFGQWADAVGTTFRAFSLFGDFLIVSSFVFIATSQAFKSYFFSHSSPLFYLSNFTI